MNRSRLILRPTPRLIAHRGACGHAPENTLAAMQKAKDLGASWVEFDVRLSGDGQVIVIHDTNVRRTTDGQGEVASLSYAEIRELDAGSWFSPAFAGEHIPQLSEVLSCLQTLGLVPNIEIKPYPGQDEETAIAVLQVLDEYWPKHAPPPLISSFSLCSLRKVREINPDIPVGFVLDKWQADWQVTADSLDCVSVHLSVKSVNIERVREVKSTGRLVLVYMVNTAAKAKKLFDMGVDGVFSDFPDILRACSPRAL